MRTTKTKKLWLGAATAAVLAMMMPAGAQAQTKPPIKIAHTGPMSGILATTGKLQSLAVDLGVADVNAKGGINGSKLEVVRYDDGLKPDEGVLRVRDAMAANAICIIGPISGTQWETVAPLLNQLKFPGFNINANKPGINKQPWAFRLAVPDDTGAPEGLAEFIKLHPKMKNIVVMGDVREASGKAAVGIWQELAKKNGLKVVDVVNFTSGQSDFSPIAIKVKEDKPDGILLSMLAPDAVRLARELQVQGVKVPILGNSLIWPGTLPQTLSETVGQDAALWYTTGYSTNDWSTGNAEMYKSFVKRWSAEVLEVPGMAKFTPPNVANSALGYDVVLLIAQIMKDEGIDGNTPVAEARQKMMEGMMKVKQFTAINAYKIRDTGDGYVPNHALHIDPTRKEWVRSE